MYHVFTRIIRLYDSPTGYITSIPGRLGKHWSFGSFLWLKTGAVRNLCGKLEDLDEIEAAVVCFPDLIGYVHVNLLRDG